MNNRKKRIRTILAVLIVIVLALILALQWKKSGLDKLIASNISQVGTSVPAPTDTTTASAATAINNPDLLAAPVNADAKLTSVQRDNLNGAKVAVVGANPISSGNKVLTTEGLPTDSAVMPGDQTAPRQTGFLNKDSLAKTLTQISITSGKFTPSELTTYVGAPTSFSLTSGDSQVHVLNFNDPALSAVAILVGPGQTKAITFNAPAKAGSYTFYDSTPDSNAKGILIVK